MSGVVRLAQSSRISETTTCDCSAFGIVVINFVVQRYAMSSTYVEPLDAHHRQSFDILFD